MIGACDTALWDIAAKTAGMPLYKYLGAGRSSVGAYASSQVLDSREAYAEEALKFKADGWKPIKFIHRKTRLKTSMCAKRCVLQLALTTS